MEAAKAAAVRDFVISMFEQSDPVKTRGEPLTARELLDRGAERIAIDLADQPELRMEMLRVMGGLYYNLGLYDRSITLYGEAVEIQRAGSRGRDLVLAETLAALGSVYREKGDYDRAEPLVREALGIRRRLAGGDHGLLGSTMDALGLVLTEKGDYDAGEPLLRRVVELNRTMLGEGNRRVATNMSNLAAVLKAKGDYEGALALYKRPSPGSVPSSATSTPTSR